MNMKRVCALALTLMGVAFATPEAQHAQADSVPSTPVDTAIAGPMAGAENVKRAVFTTNVMNREPVDQVDSLAASAGEVYFFTEIVGLEGGAIKHRWIYGGETMAELTFDIGGPRWRLYSIKTLGPERTGEWTVEVTDAKGYVIRTETLVYE